MRQTHVRGMLVVALAAVCVYAWALGAPFKAVDDQVSIVANPAIRSVENIPKIFTSSFFEGDSFYRPLVTVSFMLEYHAFGLRPFFFNLGNLLLHILNAWLVYGVLYQLLYDRRVAFWTALIFAVHPLQWEAVMNIPGRSNLLSALGVLASLYGFIRYSDEHRRRWFLLSLAGFAFGLLSKESAVTLPFVITLYILFGIGRGEYAWARVWMSVPYWLGLAVYLNWREHIGIAGAYPWPDAASLILAFVTFLRGVLTYIRLALFPVDVHFDRSLALLGGWTDPVFLGTLAVYASFVLVLWLGRKRLQPVIYFATLWFFCELLPVSQVPSSIGVQPGVIALNEHFVYTAIVPVFLILVLAVRSAANRLVEVKLVRPFVIRLAVGGWIVFWGLLTVRQAVVASDERMMFNQSVTIQPDNARVQYALGLVEAHRKDFAAAESRFRRAIELHPGHDSARIALGKALADQGRLKESAAVYETVSAAEANKDLLTLNRTVVLLQLAQEAADVSRREPANARWAFTEGVYLAQAGKAEEALAAFERTLTLDPDHADALFNAMSISAALGRSDEAETYAQRLLALPDVDAGLRERAGEMSGGQE